MSARAHADDVEVRFLRVLVALAEEGTFTDAAIRLGTSQPVVSRTLSRFEAVLGVRLVERTTRSMRLTPAGEACYQRAVEALGSLEAVVDAALGRTRPLRLGYAWAAFGEHTRAVLGDWRARHPDLPLEVHRIDERSAGLRDGVVDVAVRRGPVTEPGVHVEPLVEEDRVAAVPDGSPLAERASLTLADLADHAVALSPNGTTTLELWPAEHRPSRVVSASNTDEWLLAVATGDAVGVTASATVTQHPHPGVRYVPLSGVPGVVVSLVWPLRDPHPAVTELLAVVRDHLGH